jgi:hypothetical protein
VAARHWDERALKRLGVLMQARREELDPRYHVRKVFAAERGIHLRKAADLENGWRGDFPPLTLKEEFAPAYGVTFESVLAVLDGDGDLEALPGTPPHKSPLRRRRPAAPRKDEEIPGVLSMLATPGIDAYLERLDAERREPGWEPANADELRIWLDPRLKDPAKRALVAYRRMVWDQAVRSRDTNAGLLRSNCR